MPGGWLMVLCALLFLREPMRFARELTTSLDTLGMRGVPALVELAAHAVTAIITVAAGWGLWIRNPQAPALARVALVASGAVTVQTLYWSSLPTSTVPGQELPLAILAIAYTAGWLAYLRYSRRVRAWCE